MSVRYSVVVQNADGDAQIGLTVQLYEFGKVPGVDPPVATMTDNGDGSYYCAVSTSGKYSVAIAGAIQDELNGIYISADDLVKDISGKADKVSGAVLNNLAGLDASGNLKDSGLSASGVLTTGDIIDNLTSSSTVDALSAKQGKALKDAADALSGKVGDADFQSCVIVSNGADITEAIEELDRQVYQNSIAGGGEEGAASRCFIAFAYSGATGADNWLEMMDGISSLTGYPMGRSGSITGIYASWSGGSIASSDIFTLQTYINGSTASGKTEVLDTEVSGKIHTEQFMAGLHTFKAGDRLGIKWARMYSDYLTDLTVLIEVLVG